MNMLKRTLAMMLVLVMLFSVVPFSVFADETVETTAATEAVEAKSGGPGNSDFGHSQGKGKDKDHHKDPQDQTEATEVTEETVPETTVETVPETTEETVPETTEETVPETTEETIPEVTVPQKLMMAAAPAAETETNVASSEGVYTGTVERPSEFMRVFHLDAGRKYFNVDQVKGILDVLGEKGYSHMELAVGNDALRFLLDDMSVGAYDSATVTAGVKAGNSAYSHAGEWSEDDMDAIIAYAKTKGIEIIPLLNTPGHMDSILDAMEACGISGSYNGSARTVDVSNADAVAFTQELVGKYMAYFASKGCTYFNIGADEYANDKYNSGSMGFGNLITANLYDEFIDYINQLVAMAVDTYGLRPIAFNDGIYFQNNTKFGTFDTRLIISYWSGGWGSYALATPSFLQGKNHLILNTSDLMYYVMGRVSSGDYNYNAALSRAQTYDVDGTVSGAIGAMQCVWCDEPNAEYTADEQTRVQNLISTLASANPTVYTGPNEVPSAPEPEVPEDVGQTVTDENVAVTAPGLTGLDVQQITENVPAVEGAKAVVAYSVAPATAEGSYTGEATVSIPVPAEWTNVRGGVLESAAGLAAMDIEGELLTAEDGTKTFTFTAPHFSTVVAYEVAPTAEGNEVLVELTVGQTSQTYTDNSGYYTTAEGLDTAVASAAMGGNAGSEATVKYTSTSVSYRNLATETSWAKTDYYHYVDGQYYPVYAYYYRNFMSTRYYYGYSKTDSSTDITQIYNSTSGNTTVSLYTKTGTEAVPAQTTVSFTGVSVGETTATIGSTTYKIVVSKGAVAETITVGGSKVYTDNSTNVTVDNEAIVAATPDGNGKLTITAKAAGTATVTTDNAVYTITVVEFDPSSVAPLTVEYWITNIITRTVESTSENPVTTQQISAAAAGVTTAEGADINAMMPEWTVKRDGDSGADRQVEFWHVRLLDKTQTNNSTSKTEEQTTDSADDETTNGDAVTRVRYYDPGDGNGRRWQMLSGSTWLDVNQTNNQIVAYYMEVVDIQNANGTTELHVNAADWGKLGDNSPASSYADTNKYCSISLQIVYEDGSGNPATTTAADLDSKTLIFNYWDNGRGIGTFAFDTLGQFDIYQITAETGAVSVTFTGGAWGTAQVNSFSWDNNEKVVWSGESETASIFNNTSHPSSADPLDNLMWNENKEAILIRVYVRAVETEDSLSVVYIDEKFNDTLYSYNIQVPAEKNFNNAMIGTPGTLENGRINVSGCGIENVYGQTQNFQTDLTKVPEAKGKYDSELYTYTGSEISEDGKTLYLYYNINTSVLKPNYVVDFGLPFTFPLSDVTNTPNLVKNVTVSARYGSVSYDSATETFRYNFNGILPNVDVLSVNILFDGESTVATSNVGVTPATSVYYEESFLLSDNATGWTSEAPFSGTQTTAVLGHDANDYGYDAAYAGKGISTCYVTGTTGASTTFTFTGTGFQLYANSWGGDNASGFVTVYSKGGLSKLYMIDTQLSAGNTSATDQQTGGTYYGLPIISETSLPHGEYTVQLKQTKGDKPIYLDGVRILNTVKDQAAGEENIYYADQEDNPNFYEVRDMVLKAIGVEDLADSDYIRDPSNDRDRRVEAVKDMAGQVYNAVSAENGSAIVIDENNTYGTGFAQDLLDNGPKNELYLYPGQTLTFNVNTTRAVQLGLKSPVGHANYTLNGSVESISTTVDMFYMISEKAASNGTVNVTISVPQNEGTEDNGVLSVTLLKICDDPGVSFPALTQEDIENTLLSVYGLDQEEAPVEPSEPEVPEETTRPTKPGKPEKPDNGNKPGNGNNKPTEPSKPGNGNGNSGKPSADKNEKQKDAKLKITFVNLMGKKVASATLTKTGTANQNCVFSADEITANAPARRYAVWFFPVIIPYGSTSSIVVPVF